MGCDVAITVTEEYLAGLQGHASGPQPTPEGVLEIVYPDVSQADLFATPLPGAVVDIVYRFTLVGENTLGMIPSHLLNHGLGDPV